MFFARNKMANKEEEMAEFMEQVKNSLGSVEATADSDRFEKRQVIYNMPGAPENEMDSLRQQIANIQKAQKAQEEKTEVLERELADLRAKFLGRFEDEQKEIDKFLIHERVRVEKHDASEVYSGRKRAIAVGVTLFSRYFGTWRILRSQLTSQVIGILLGMLEDDQRVELIVEDDLT